MKNLQKHLIAAALKGDSRPILKGVEFNQETNRMNATDSHRLLSVAFKGTIETNKVINLDTMEQLDGSYPSISRLIPRNGDALQIAATEFRAEDIKRLTALKKEVVKVDLSSSELAFFNDKTGEYLFSIEPQTGAKVQELSIYLNASYLKDAFRFLVDFQKANKGETVTFLYQAANRPVLFSSQDESFQYLITPIRKA